MPSAIIHVPVGILSGGGAAWTLSADQQLLDRVLRTVAGAFGGYHGSRLPDEFEPASSPNHRALALNRPGFFGDSVTGVQPPRLGAPDLDSTLPRTPPAERTRWARAAAAG